MAGLGRLADIVGDGEHQPGCLRVPGPAIRRQLQFPGSRGNAGIGAGDRDDRRGRDQPLELPCGQLLFRDGRR